MQVHQQRTKPENPLASILINIIIPVLVLQHLSQRLGPAVALILALLPPLIYGALDYYRNHHRNYIALFGVINTLLTGVLALQESSPFWFIFKEGTFPLLIGAGVFLSAFSPRPFLAVLIWNPQILQTELVESRLKERGNEIVFQRQLRLSTFFLSGSFLLSSLLNFFLAASIFRDIDPTLAADARMERLNEQIAQMNWQGYVVIALPLMIVMALIMIQFFSSLRKLTGLETSELMRSHSASRSEK